VKRENKFFKRRRLDKQNQHKCHRQNDSQYDNKQPCFLYDIYKKISKQIELFLQLIAVISLLADIHISKQLVEMFAILIRCYLIHLMVTVCRRK